MRIAMMIESDGPGGAETLVFRLAEELRRRGHIIIPVGPRKGTGWLGSAFRNAGFDPEVYWLDRPIDPRAVRRLTRLFHQHAIDLVHSHDFTMAVYGTAATRMTGLPHVITMHGGVNVCAALRRRIALRWAMSKSAATVMVSNATAVQFASELGRARDDFVVIPNGVPVHTGDPDAVRAEFGIRAGEVVILAVGNLEPHKGHRFLLEALVRISERAPDLPWRLIIAGGRGGSEHEALRNFVHARQMGNRIHIATGRSDIPDLQSMADIFVMPSLIEGLPMALLEAMVAGKAVIASATAGIPEAVVNGREGILVQPGNVGELTDALHALILNPVQRERLSVAAERRSHAEFTLDVMADRYEALYQNALSNRDKRAAMTVSSNDAGSG